MPSCIYSLRLLGIVVKLLKN